MSEEKDGNSTALTAFRNREIILCFVDHASMDILVYKSNYVYNSV